MDESILGIIYIALWIFAIFYCRRVAKKLNYNQDVALVASIVIPIPALILYFYYSIRTSKKNFKIIKMETIILSDATCQSAAIQQMATTTGVCTVLTANINYHDLSANGTWATNGSTSGVFGMNTATQTGYSSTEATIPYSESATAVALTETTNSTENGVYMASLASGYAIANINRHNWLDRLAKDLHKKGNFQILILKEGQKPYWVLKKL